MASEWNLFQRDVKRRVKQGLLLMVLIIPGLVALKVLGVLLERTMYILVAVLAVGGTLWLERKARKR